MKTKKIKVVPLEVSVLKTGTSQGKNGGSFGWTLYKVVCNVLPKGQRIEMTGFDELQPGMETVVEIWQEETEYGKKFRFRKPKRNVYSEIDELRKRVDKLEARLESVADLVTEEEEIDIGDLGEEPDDNYV